MRKIFTLFIILISLSGFSQDFRGGLFGGLVASQIAGDNDSGYNKAGINIGGFANIQITRKSLLQMELSFFQKGSKHNPNYEEGDMRNFVIRASYFEMPFLYQYILNEEFKIEIGPSIGVNFSSYQEIDEQEQPSDNFRLINASINLGVYYELSDKMSVNIRSNNSLINIRNEVQSGMVNRFGWFGQYNDALVLSLYYYLN